MDLAYAYANARIKGMESKLLGESKLRELFAVSTPDEMSEILEGTAYRESFVWASTKFSGNELIMRALHEDFRRTIARLLRVVPRKGYAALREVLKDYEVQNISAIIASKAKGIPFKDTDLVPLEEKEQALLKTLESKKDVEEIVAALKNTEFGSVLFAALPEYRKEKDFRVLQNALHAYQYKKLFAFADKQKSPVIRDLLLSRVWNTDLMVLLRIKKSNPELDASPHLARQQRFLVKLNAMKDFERMMAALKAERPALAAAVDESLKRNSLIPLEIALERELARRTLRSLRMSVLDFGTVLGYLYLKFEEVSTIRKIAYAKKFGFSDELKEMIFIAV